MTAKFIKVTKTSTRNDKADDPAERYWREPVIINTSSIDTIRVLNHAEAGFHVNPADEARAMIVLKGKDAEFFRVRQTVEEIDALLKGE